MNTSQTIFRVEKNKDNPYVMINKTMLDDNRLSWKAKGILSYLLSMPDDWQVYESEIQKHASDGIDSLSSGIKELIDKGYIKRERKRNEQGHLKGYEYVIYEVSTESGLSKVGLSKVGLSKNGKSKTTNNDLTNNDSTNNNLTKYSTHFEKLWILYPAKKGKGRISNSRKKELYKLGDEFERCITRYINEVEKKRLNGFKELQYQNGSTFFNSGYIDYLDKNYEEMIKNGDHRGNDSEDEYSKLGWSFEDMQEM